jgi:copper chaperone NosL
MTRTLAAALVLLAACSAGPPPPAALDTRNESCASCRMAISEARFAAQIVAPFEEPRFFDDIGCLARFVQDAHALAPGAVAYVADHRTRAWVRADAAVYVLAPSVTTPMGSHLLAHADAVSRDADPEAAGGSPRTVAQVFGPGRAPGGGR